MDPPGASAPSRMKNQRIDRFANYNPIQFRTPFSDSVVVVVVVVVHAGAVVYAGAVVHANTVLYTLAALKKKLPWC